MIWIPELGHLALIFSLYLSLFSCGLALAKNQLGLALAWKLVRSNIIGQAFFGILSFGVLLLAFAQDDFSVAYVAHNSTTELALIYKLCALWGGHEGSMLLWYLILCLWSLWFIVKAKASSVFNLNTAGVLALLGAGFSLFILKTSNPFTRLLPNIPINGADLNPLLQDPGFILHPPILYLGYVGFALPFAMALAYLLAPDNIQVLAQKMQSPVRWAWSFLTLGITLGSWWAYYELGWGGWWFWDPVENASLMPWLGGTALLHSVRAASKRAQFGNWLLFLALFCFSMSMLGTFLVRSGILTSVHAFAADPGRGRFILIFITLTVGAAFLLYGLRYQAMPWQLRLFSKEGLLVTLNTLLVVCVAIVLLGTLYPMFADAWFNQQLSVGPPYFNKVLIPIFLLLMMLMSFAPYIRWSQDSWQRFKRPLIYIGGSSVIFGGVSRWLLPWQLDALALFGLLVAAILILVTLYSLVKGLKKFFYGQRRFDTLAMHCGHLGISVLAVGIILTSALSVEKDVLLKPGEATVINGTTFKLEGLESTWGPNFEGVKANFSVQRANKAMIQLFPEKRFYMPREMPITETAIYANIFMDYYIALGEPVADNQWSVKICLKPFVRWLWLGGLMIALGGLIAALGTRWPTTQVIN